MLFLTFRNVMLLFSASLLLISLLSSMAIVQATPETIVKVEPELISANIGEQITANISIIEVQNLYGIEIVLYWNSSILVGAHADVRLGEPDGTLHNPISIVENSTTQNEGKYVLSAVSYSPAPPFNGSGTIVIITFNVVGSGTSKLDLQSELWDYPPPDMWPRISYPIEHTTIDGFVTVIPEFPQMVILPILILLTAFVAVLSRKMRSKRQLQ